MQKSKLIRKGRKGFTLVEVALAVAVGLIIIGGVIVGYNAVKDNAAGSAARDKVNAAVGIIENYASANNQTYPKSVATGGVFTSMWDKGRSADYANNPWGGATKNASGTVEIAAGAFGFANTTAAASDTATPLAVGAGQSGIGDIIYESNNDATKPWGHVTDISTSNNTVVKNYVVSLFDKDGTPWWYVKGGS